MATSSFISFSSPVCLNPTVRCYFFNPFPCVFFPPEIHTSKAVYGRGRVFYRPISTRGFTPDVNRFGNRTDFYCFRVVFARNRAPKPLLKAANHRSQSSVVCFVSTVRPPAQHTPRKCSTWNMLDLRTIVYSVALSVGGNPLAVLHTRPFVLQH